MPLTEKALGEPEIGVTVPEVVSRAVPSPQLIDTVNWGAIGPVSNAVAI